MEFEMINFDAIRVYDFITKTFTKKMFEEMQDSEYKYVESLFLKTNTYENFLEFQKQSIHNLEITNVAEFKILQILIHQITNKKLNTSSIDHDSGYINKLVINSVYFDYKNKLVLHAS